MDKIELKKFHGALTPEALDVSNTLYVQGVHNCGDTKPIDSLLESINWNENSQGAYLFTGVAGIGKTTELRRLCKSLEDDGHAALFVDGLDYIHPSSPISVSDFLISIILGISDMVQFMWKKDLFAESFASRFWDFLQTEMKFTEVSVGPKSASLKMSLTKDLTFKRELQKRMEGSLGKFFEKFEELLTHCSDFIRTEAGLADDKKIVLVVDSLEKIRSNGVERDDLVINSFREMMEQYSENLFLTGFHSVYSVPIYLLKLIPVLQNRFDAVCNLTNCHIFLKRSENPDENGFEPLRQIVSQRYPAWETILTKDALDQLITFSGGDLREYFQLIKKALLQAATSSATLPLSQDSSPIEYAIMGQRRDYIPLPDDGKERLRYARSHYSPQLATDEDMLQMVQDLKLHRLLVFRNGEDWYLPHPLLWDQL